MKPTEIIIRQGKPKFRRRTAAKTMRGWITGVISKSCKEGNTEMDFLFREILNAYNYFHPEKTLSVEIESWKGKSSFKIFELTETIIVKKYQKPKKGEEPKEINYSIEKEELKTLIRTIEDNWRGEGIKTKELAEKWCGRMGIEYFGWNNFFSNRKIHNKFTIMLGVLDRLGLIEYLGGITKLLEEKISLQLSLNNYDKKTKFIKDNLNKHG